MSDETLKRVTRQVEKRPMVSILDYRLSSWQQVPQRCRHANGQLGEK
jgi:hypothetical protein